MFHHVSPYELLCASKPRPAPTQITPYDLYSRIQQQEPFKTAEYALPASAPQFASPEKRTHYISDIHAKHGAANRRVSYTQQPLL